MFDPIVEPMEPEQAFEVASKVGRRIGYVVGYNEIEELPAGLMPNFLYLGLIRGFAPLDPNEEVEDDPIEDDRHERMENSFEASWEEGKADREAGRDARYDLSEILDMAPFLYDTEREFLLEQIEKASGS